MHRICSLISGVAICLLLLPVTVHAQNPTLQFFQGNFNELQSEAINKQSPYFIYFYFDGCPNCQMMEEKTLNYPALTSYAHYAYIPFRVNAYKDEDGRGIADDYGVRGFPAILIFGPNGEVWDKVYGYTSGYDLYRKLVENKEAHLEQTNVEIDLVSKPNGEIDTGIDAYSPTFIELDNQNENFRETVPTPIPVFDLTEPPTFPKTEKEEISKANATQSVKVSNTETQRKIADAPPPIPKPTPKPEVKPEPVYISKLPITLAPFTLSPIRRESKKQSISLKPYGILVGSYRTLQEFEENALWFERMWQGDIWAFKTDVSYEMILGSYETEEEAWGYAVPMKKIGMLDPQIVDFRKMFK